MPENDMATEAGDDLARGDSAGADDESTENDQGRDDTYFLPKGILEGKDVKPGDIVKFKVLGEDKDGNVEVECMDDNKDTSKMSWQDDMRASVPDGGSSPNGQNPSNY